MNQRIRTYLNDRPDMKQALIVSVLFHVLIVVLSVAGLPFIKKTPPEISAPPPISIEFVAPPSKTKAKKPAVPKPRPKRKPPAPPKMTAKKAPDLSEVKAPVLKNEPPPEKQAKSVPLPKKDPPKKKAKKPEPKRDEKLTKQVKSEDNQQFNSLLKNLMDTEEPEPERSFEDIRKELASKSIIPEQEEAEAPSPQEDQKKVQQILDNLNASPYTASRNVPSLDNQLSFSEIGAVKHQLSGCWNVLSGARYAENLQVEVKLYMNPDRTVRKAFIVDTVRYNQDALFRAAADSVLRAFKMENCRVLNLPQDKYNQWKVTIITFDPSDML